jgi:hypothetical protein
MRNAQLPLLVMQATFQTRCSFADRHKATDDSRVCQMLASEQLAGNHVSAVRSAWACSPPECRTIVEAIGGYALDTIERPPPCPTGAV